jgi:hypothetical protein
VEQFEGRVVGAIKVIIEQDFVVHNNEIDVLMAIPSIENDKVRRRTAP